jgi:urea transporter
MYKLIAILSTVMVTVGVVLLTVFVSPYAIGLITLPAIVAPFMLLDAFSR